MTTQPTHTPTPWKVSQTGKFVMHSKPGTALNVCEASVEDAAFIVHAVNTHDRLVLLVKDFMEYNGKFFDVDAQCLCKRGAEILVAAEGGNDND